MSHTHYTPAVQHLLTLGDPDDPPLDYLALRLTSAHVPELIQLATDDALRWEGEDEDLAIHGPLHAWFALGQLRASAAVEPLLTQLRYVDDEGDDWAGERLPEVLAQIGPAALPGLGRYLQDAAHGVWASSAAVEAVEKIAEAYSATRPECVAMFTQRLTQFAGNDPILNANLIYGLAKLRAVEAVPLMAEAFAAERVDETVAGDWDDIQILLGLKDKRDGPRKHTALAQLFGDIGEEITAVRQAGLGSAPREMREDLAQWNAAVEQRKREKAIKAPKPKKRKRGR